MDNGDGERETLTNPQRQIRCALIEIVLEAEPSGQRGNARLALLCRQVEEVGVKIEVLPDGQLDIEGKRLRHVADTVSRTHVPCIEGLSEQEGLAFARRQQAGQHFHGRGLAAAVGADGGRNISPRSMVKLTASTAVEPSPKRQARSRAVMTGSASRTRWGGICSL